VATQLLKDSNEVLKTTTSTRQQVKREEENLTKLVLKIVVFE